MIPVGRQVNLAAHASTHGDVTMRIAVTSKEDTLTAEVDPRFGRTKYFLLVDTETSAFEVVRNDQQLDSAQGAGIQVAQSLARHRPHVLLTGNCGPKAFRTLQAAGIQVVVGVTGTATAAIRAYLDGQLEPAVAANVEGHWV
jgi:predicted Fe-Mo cluster-binding NifX family protein